MSVKLSYERIIAVNRTVVIHFFNQHIILLLLIIFFFCFAENLKKKIIEFKLKEFGKCNWWRQGESFAFRVDELLVGVTGSSWGRCHSKSDRHLNKQAVTFRI